MAAALVSAATDTPTNAGMVYFGEIGLSGEVRQVAQADSRLKEAAKLGFEQATLPRRVARGNRPAGAARRAGAGGNRPHLRPRRAIYAERDALRHDRGLAPRRLRSIKPPAWRFVAGSMTWVDLVVLAVLAVSALLAFMRGLVREVLGLAAWVGAIFSASGRCRTCGRSSSTGWASRPGSTPIAFAVVFIVSLIVLLLVSRWISALVRASPIGGLDRTLGLVFGLARGAALCILAYIGAGMVVQVDRWPEPVLNAESIWPVYRGASWVVEQLPTEYRPRSAGARRQDMRRRHRPCCRQLRRAGQWAGSRTRIGRVLAWQ